MRAGRDASGIFLPDFDIIEIHVVGVSVHNSFPAAIGPSVCMFQICSRLLLHCPVRQGDDGKGYGAGAAGAGGGNGYTTGGVTGGVGDGGVAASGRIQAARAAGDRPGGRSGIYGEAYLLTDADTGAGTIGGGGGYSLRSDCATGAAASARASGGCGCGTRRGITWTTIGIRHFSGYLEFVGVLFLGRLFRCGAAFLHVSPGLVHRGKRAFESPRDT